MLKETFVQPYLERFRDFTENKIKDKLNELKIDDFEFLQNQMQEYLNKNKMNYYMKSLLYRENGQYINDVYVDIPLRSNGNEIYSEELINLVNYGYSEGKGEPSYIFISGIGGSGKSILMKKLFLEFLINTDNEHLSIPILIRLKSLKVTDDNFLEDYILTYFKKMDIKFSPELVKLFLKEGNIVLQFDGLDELKFKEKKEFLFSLESFIQKYSNTSILVSTRPESLSNILPNFTLYKMERMNEEQVESYIQKLPYTSNIDYLCEKILEPSYFSAHKELVGHPLVLAILILTFDFNGELPVNSASFYSKVYQTMLSTHDKDKEVGFDRGIATNLNHASLERVFEIFCFVTYVAEEYSFDLAQFNTYVDKTITLFCNEKNRDFEELNRENFEIDFVHLLCFLIEEGGYYDFIHRTFQEFYTAKFILSLDDDKQMKFFSREDNTIFLERGGVLSYLNMLNQKKYLYTAISNNLRGLVEIYDQYSDKIEFIRDYVEVVDFGLFRDNKYYVMYEESKYSISREEMLDIEHKEIDYSSVGDVAKVLINYSDTEFSPFQMREEDFLNFQEIFLIIISCEIEFIRKWLSDYEINRKSEDILDEVFWS